MSFKISALITIIFFLMLTKIKSEIPNCLFVNTVNITDTQENDDISNFSENLTAYYDYIVLNNGSKIVVPLHKRFCMCPNPCLSICKAEIIDYYEEDPDIRSIYLRNVTFEDGVKDQQDFIEFFNHRLTDLNCTNHYPLLMEVSDSDKWSIFENGTLLIHHTNEYRNQDEYCFDFYTYEDQRVYIDNSLSSDFVISGSVLSPYVCPIVNDGKKKDIVKNVAMGCSIPFFLMTICLYCFLPKLRNCHGKCFVMYLLYLTVNYSLVCYNTLSEFSVYECLSIGYTIYFTTIGFLTWISIISYDTYVSLTDLDCPKLFRTYFKWGSIIPLTATLIIFVIQSLKIIDEEQKPGIDRDSCGVKVTRWSAFFYYYIPHIIVLIYCMILYIKLIRYLVVNERDATSFGGRQKTRYMKRFSLYFRLFIFMGVFWFLEILSYLIDMTIGPNTITIITDLFNALHGLFIFFSIVFNSRIYNYFRKRCLPESYSEQTALTTRTLDFGESS